MHEGRNLRLEGGLPKCLLVTPTIVTILTLSICPLFENVCLDFLGCGLMHPGSPTFGAFTNLRGCVSVFGSGIFVRSVKGAMG